MNIHPRYYKVRDAENELRRFLLELEEKHDLTLAEVTSILGSAISNTCKYLIRSERHPDDPDKKGDEA